MSRTTSADRVWRILDLVPWVLRRAEPPTLQEAAEHLGVTAKEIQRDLTEIVQFIGVYPFTPDAMIEVSCEGDRIEFFLAPFFTRPLRPKAREALALLAIGKAALDLDLRPPGEAGRGGGSEVLSSALDKLAIALTGGATDPVAVDLDRPPAEVFDPVRQATDNGRVLEIDYYSSARDARSVRQVEPLQLAAARGHWYLSAWCRAAGAPRRFRVDRIVSARMLDEEVVTRAEVEPVTPHPDATRITVDLPESARWLTEYQFIESAEELPDGGLRVVMPVWGDAWLERLLLQLWPVRAQLPEGDAGAVVAGAAARILSRYRRLGA